MSRKKILWLLPLFVLASCGGAPAETSSVLSSEPSQESQPSQSEASDPSQPSATTQSTEISEDHQFDPDDFENSFCIHYHRDDADYKNWFLWLWPDGGDGANYFFEYADSYGGVCVTPLSTFSTNRVGLIVRNESWAKDPDGDRFVDLTEYTPDKNGNIQIWLYTEISLIYDEEPTNIAYLSTCAFTDMKTINVTAGAGKLYGLEVLEGGESLGKIELEGVTNFRITLDHNALLDKPYVVKATFASAYTIETGVSLSGIFSDPAFNAAYAYDGELGAIYSSESTTFKVWSPVSEEIDLLVYSTGTPASIGTEEHPGSDTPILTMPMAKGEKGVFSVTVDGDLDGYYYTYRVKNYVYPLGKEVVDPYARSAGVNGLRGMILNLERTDPEGFRDFTLPAYDRLASVVYETHIADLTSSETWGGNPDNAKKYAGFHEAGTEYAGVSTGFDHIKELGVSAVQILPMFDQANDEVNVEFNWGYNPLNYNVPEGCYASDPYDGAIRVRELKELIQAYGEAGISIIMDVVYNHVNSVSGQNFDVLMPYYYFRYNGVALYNGSGCGNETASDRYMFRKFMLDSTTYWTREYRLGGFRFDLMGLHDLTTMSLLTKAVESINPGAIIYGEPWAGGTSGLPAAQACNQSNVDKFDGYGCFSDRIRDGLIAGGLSDKLDKAWATLREGVTDEATLKKFTSTSKAAGAKLVTGVMGAQSLTKDPALTVSYASCHDNYTLYDRVKAAYSNENIALTDEEALRMNRLAQSVVMTSQGTAFMLAGEEFLRSKGGNSNSYNASYEVNELDYALKVAHPELVEDYKALINFKRTLPGLHLDLEGVTAADKPVVTKNKNFSCLAYNIHGGVEGELLVIHCNGIFDGTDLDKIDQLDLGNGKVLFDSLHTGIETLTSVSELRAMQTLIIQTEGLK